MQKHFELVGNVPLFSKTTTSFEIARNRYNLFVEITSDSAMNKSDDVLLLTENS